MTDAYEAAVQGSVIRAGGMTADESIKMMKMATMWQDISKKVREYCAVLEAENEDLKSKLAGAEESLRFYIALSMQK